MTKVSFQMQELRARVYVLETYVEELTKALRAKA